MDSKKQQTTRQWNNAEPWEYRTGSTAPRKSHRGLIAVLLVAVIILGGAVSILGIMNIQLFRQLAKDNYETLPFLLSSNAPEQEAAEPSSDDENQVFSQEGTVLATESGIGTLEPDVFTQGVPTEDTVHGICAEPVPVFHQHYYQLPQGLFITQVLPDSCAEAAGLRTGDILLCLNGSSMTDLSILQSFFDSCTPGGTISFTVYRNGETITFSFRFPDTDH